MKKTLFSIIALTCLILAACKKGAQHEDRSLQAGITSICKTKILPQIITGTRVLSNDTVYILDGKCFVPNGSELIIEPGTRIEAVRYDDAKWASALVITRGGKIYAYGDSCQPIVFTPHIDETNPAADPGDWGGVIILGKAPVNKVNPAAEGIDPATLPQGIDFNYGGTQPADNSGLLQYVRIEYAGLPLSPDNELNSLTLCGVGYGTTIHHVESAWSGDDAFEFFGGRVNARYLVALSPADDGLDFDNGYTGAVQFALIVRSQCCYENVFARANGVECDNDLENSGALPKTRPVLSNLTIVGSPDYSPGLLHGAFFRRSAAYIMRNSVIIGYGNDSSRYGAKFETGATKTEFKYNLVHTFGPNYTNVPPLDTTNRTYPNILSSGLINPFTCGTSGTALHFAPMPATPPVVFPANFFTGWPLDLPSPIDAYLNKSVTYRGAFPVNNRNWLGCWSTCAGFLPATMLCD